ncbi:MAG: radical SAM protein [Clostridia bacterium]|nr:radical SAM protein [Clostridia bacterium]
MKATKRELLFAEKNFNEVHHTTLNPEGPGAVRIHLVPPKTEPEAKQIYSGTAIINGQDVLPVGVSWSVLLVCLIGEINKFSGRQISQEDVNGIVDNTVAVVRKTYPLVPKKRLRSDIYRIMSTFKNVAYGLPVEEDIEYIRMGDWAPFMKAPHRIDLLVSAMTKDGMWHCNQKCVHCYAAGQKQAEEQELDTETWKKIIDKCRAIGVSQVTFTGGEPTMREDIFELIKYARWFITRLNTNGRKLTPEYCAELKKCSLDSMQVTFYSSDPAVHNQLVGTEGFADTAAGIENALAAGINLSVNTPLCTLNRDYVSTLKYLHERGVLYVTCSGLITTGNAAGEASGALQLTGDEMKEVLREAVEYCFANGMEISFTSPGWVDEEFCRELGINVPVCGACLSNMAITPGGSVVPCQSWLSDQALGNFLDDDWETVWNGEACSARRAYSATMCGECPLRVRGGRNG